MNEIKRLAEFLGINREDSFLEKVSENCQFEVMKKKYTDEKLDACKFKAGTGFYRKGMTS